jgi:lipopolysaccharide transport system ATP-binding protein
VAAHLEPEILLVDEVLAVGDAAFQKRCLGKMGEVARAGRTVLLISHNMIAVESLCRRVILLHEGRLVEDGEPRQVLSTYLKEVLSDSTEQEWHSVSKAPGNDKIRLRRAAVRPLHGSPSDSITVRTPLVLEFDYWNLRPEAYLNLSVSLINGEGLTVLSSHSLSDPVWGGQPFPTSLFRTSCHIPADLLNDGQYQVHLMVVEHGGTVIYSHPEVLVFDVVDAAETRDVWYGKWPGVVRPKLEWTGEVLAPANLCGTASPPSFPAP